MTSDADDGRAVPGPRTGNGAGIDTVRRPPPVPGVDLASLREGLDQRLRQQQAVAALGLLALRSTDVQQVVDEAVRCIVATIDVAIVAVIRRTADGLVVVGAHGFTPRPDGSIDEAISPAAQVIRSGRHLVVPDTRRLVDPTVRKIVLDAGGRSSVFLPVGDPASPWGSISVHAPRLDAFTEDDVHFLAAVGNVVAAAAVRAQAERELAFRAGHDTLTGLPNRDQLRTELDRVLLLARPGEITALLLLDLDDFKDVNDSQGHQVGDDVLREVGCRLSGRLRENDVVARLGGDEFAVVLTGLFRAEQARVVATELVALMRQPFVTRCGTIALGASVGVAVAPEHAGDPETLMRRADLAMYRAKREHSGVGMYDPEFELRASQRLWMVNDLRTAIVDEQITLAFQPIIDLRTREVTSVEALARWTHPTRGPQSPVEFVALAESSGLVGDLTDLVLRIAARQCADWLAAGRRLAMGVNLPPSLMCSADFADYLVRATTAQGMPFDLLRAEVTEQALASDEAIAVLHRIHQLGARVAVDDFGTGWSSLGRLKQLPVQTLKIDRSFITSLQEDARDVAIVRAVVALADQLGMRTIAEGIETAGTVDLLAELGVDRAQGYLFARPLPAAELAAWHDAWLAGDHPWLRGVAR